MLSVASALTWPAFGMPTIIPYCCWTEGSEAVGSMRPYSSGVPLYLSRSGNKVEALTVSVGNRRGRARPHGAGGLRHGSAVLGHQRAGHAVEGACPVDVVLHDLDARDLS